MAKSFFRRLFSSSLRDVEPGDAVRVVGYRGVCFVSSVKDDHAVVVWGKDRRDILPIVALRRVRAVGHIFDRRGE